MKNIRYILLVSACCFLPKESIAEINLTFNASDIVSSNPTLHTHHTPVVLKPISNFVKLAAVCALAKGGCDNESFNLDNATQCKDEGFVNSCSSGYCMDKSCPYTNTYGKCISENCPANSSPTCTGAVAGKNACGNNCYKCCSDECSKGSKTNTGSLAGKTECGNNCYNCNTTCPNGSSTSYSGAIVGYNECGTACKSCSTACPSGTSTYNPGGCGGSTRNECRSQTCYYPYQSCCSPSCSDEWGCSCGSYSISDGCGGTCNRCSSCCTHETHVTCQYGCATECPCDSSCTSCRGPHGRYGVWVGNYACWTGSQCPGNRPYTMVQDVDVYCEPTGQFICRRGGYKSATECWATKSECEANYSSYQKFYGGQQEESDGGDCSKCGYF